jgi:hypothetical protein
LIKRAAGDQNILETSIISALARLLLPRRFSSPLDASVASPTSPARRAHLHATRRHAHKNAARKPKCPENVSIKEKDGSFQSNIGWLCPVLCSKRDKPSGAGALPLIPLI